MMMLTFYFCQTNTIKGMLNIPSVERKLDALRQRVMIISLLHTFGPKCMGHNWGFLQSFISQWSCSNKTANSHLRGDQRTFARTVGERKNERKQGESLYTSGEMQSQFPHLSLYCFCIDFEVSICFLLFLSVQTIIVSNWKGYLNTIKPEDKARSFATSSQY